MPLFQRDNGGGDNIEYVMCHQYKYIPDPEEPCCAWLKENVVIIENGQVVWQPSDINKIKHVVIWDSVKEIEKVFE